MLSKVIGVANRVLRQFFGEFGARASRSLVFAGSVVGLVLVPWGAAAADAPPQVREVWAVDLGGTVTGAPRLGRGPGGHATAFVATHHGRVAAVALEGPSEGRVVADAWFPAIFYGDIVGLPSGDLVLGGDDDVLRCLDAQTLKVTWAQRLGACEPARARGPVGAWCDVDAVTLAPDGMLFVAADGVYAVTQQGEVRWHVGHATEPFHVAVPPLVLGDRVVFGAQDGAVHAVSRTGQPLWHYVLGPDVDGAPLALGPDVFAVGADDGRVYAFERHGLLLWTLEVGGAVRAPLVSASDDAFWVATLGGALVSVGPHGEARGQIAGFGPLLAAPLARPHGGFWLGDARGGLYMGRAQTVLWSVQTGTPFAAGLTMDGRMRVLVVGDEGVLHVLQDPVRMRRSGT